MDDFSDRQIIDCWQQNVEPWVAAVREGQIESRLQVTNQAIIAAVLARKPATVLDVGCGEGWLVRELAKARIDSLGVDVVPAFIACAQQAGGGRFKALSYEELSPHTLNEQFDALVCNFSLLGKASVNHLFRQAPSLLTRGGALIVQTVHPIAACGDASYEDGWRPGSWAGFSDRFKAPAPWYFRTLASWQTLFHDNGFTVSEMLEPLLPATNTPASVLFIGTLAAR